MSFMISSWIFLHSKAFLEIWQARFDAAEEEFSWLAADFLKWIVFQLFLTLKGVLWMAIPTQSNGKLIKLSSHPWPCHLSLRASLLVVCNTLPETKRSPLKMVVSYRNLPFQGPIFRAELLVSGRVSNKSLRCWLHDSLRVVSRYPGSKSKATPQQKNPAKRRMLQLFSTEIGIPKGDSWKHQGKENLLAICIAGTLHWTLGVPGICYLLDHTAMSM